MKKLLTVCCLLGALLCLVSPVFAQTQNVWRVNSNGGITLNDVPFRIKGGTWFGLEGRQDPSNDVHATITAPMEQYMGNTFWAESGRTYDQDITEIKQMGFNVVRLPLAPQTLDANDPQGKDPYLTNAKSVRISNARLALEMVIKKLDAAGIYVILDLHSCSNYVGWRKGRLDARPPYVDKDWTKYDFKRENCSCATSGNPAGVTKTQPYDKAKWLTNLKTLAGFTSSLGVTNIMGIDIFNEPWDYSWDEWQELSEEAYTAINSVNPNILLFVQGVGSTNGNQDGTPDTKNPTPHGNPDLLPYWGENLYEAGANPPQIPKERLVFSPHCFGPSVLVQGMFADPAQPECAPLERDAFGDAKCNIVINPAKLAAAWQEHFGYLKDLGYAVCIGEFGGNPDWPAKAESRVQERYSYLTDQTTDWQWQNAFVNYLIASGITDTIYWAINPESANTGGIYTTPYDPITNTGGWGTWQTPDLKRLNLLQKIWYATVPPTRTPTSVPTPTPTTTTAYLRGDANEDGLVNILDALVVARYSARLTVNKINFKNADYNLDGQINIIDALLISSQMSIP